MYIAICTDRVGVHYVKINISSMRSREVSKQTKNYYTGKSLLLC